MAFPHQQFRPLSYGEVVIYPEQSLGFGAYGKVCKAKCGQLPCAAKLLHETLFQHNDPGEQFLSDKFEHECEFLSTIRHPNIVQYLTTARDPTTGRAVLLMELMDESLKKYLERSVTPLPCHVQVNICHDVALALAYLHSNGVIHRDLSSNNVLITGRRAKVTDFGMSKLIDAYQCSQMTPLTQAPGTQYYMPPEALITPPQYNYKLDCFSFGVLTLQIASGSYPTPGEAMRYELDPRYPSGRVIVAVPERERRANDIAQVDPRNPLYPIALDCIKDIDKERPTAKTLSQRVVEVKEGHAYTASIEAGEGNSPKYYIELQRVRGENQALERELAKTKQSRQQVLGELNLEKQNAVHYRAQLDLAKQEVEAVHRKLQSVEQEVGNGEHVRKLELRGQGLADLLAEVRRKLAHTKQQLLESQQRERELQERDVTRVHVQQTALGYKEEEVQRLKRRVTECEGIISDFQAMDLSKAADVARVQRRQSSPTLRPHLNAVPNPSPSAPQLLAPPIPEWREAKPPPEEMTGYTGQVTVHEGTAYFTQNFVVYAYSESRDKWEELPRCENKQFGVAMINSKLTAIGGLDKNGAHTRDILTLKEREKKWDRVLPAMPTARVHPATITTPTHLVVAGGTYVSQDPDRSSKGYATVEIMALNTLQWSVVSSLPEVIRYPQIKHTEEHFVLLDTESNSIYTCPVEELLKSEQEAGVWKKKSSIPVKEGASLVNLEGRVLALGGLDGVGRQQNSIYCYRMPEDVWDLVKVMRTPRSLVLSVVCRDNVLVVVGGFEGKWMPCKKTEKITLQIN